MPRFPRPGKRDFFARTRVQIIHPTEDRHGRSGAMAASPRRRCVSLPLMSAAMIMAMIATHPMPWQRYLLVVIPPLVMLAGFANRRSAAAVCERGCEH
jgi:hypothetical protein